MPLFGAKPPGDTAHLGAAGRGPAGWRRPRAPLRRGVFHLGTCFGVRVRACSARRVSSRLASWSDRRSITFGLQDRDVGRRTRSLQGPGRRRCITPGKLAMTRMQAEADHLRRGTVSSAFQLRMQSYVWGQGVLEFHRGPGRRCAPLGSTGGGTQGRPTGPRTAGRFTSGPVGSGLLSGCWRRAPCRWRSCSEFCVVPHPPISRAMPVTCARPAKNQEMVIFTQGIYEARELALARMQAEAHARPSPSGHPWGVTVAGQQSRLGASTRPSFSATGNRHPAPRRRAPPARRPRRSPTFTLGLDS